MTCSLSFREALESCQVSHAVRDKPETAFGKQSISRLETKCQGGVPGTSLGSISWLQISDKILLCETHIMQRQGSFLFVDLALVGFTKRISYRRSDIPRRPNASCSEYFYARRGHRVCLRWLQVHSIQVQTSLDHLDAARISFR